MRPVEKTTEKHPEDIATSDSRFAKRNRLTDAASYGLVFKNAQRSRDKMFTVLYRDNDGGDARLGLAISKKRCKLASRRNRLKRLVRESFRRNKQTLTGLDVVVINHAAAGDAANGLITASLEKHWQRCGRATVNEAQ